MKKPAIFTSLVAAMLVPALASARGNPTQVDFCATPLEPLAPETLRALVDGNTDFALDLYKVLAEDEGNLFYSPYSVSTALAMTYAGARGATAAEMSETLGFRLPEDQLHPAFQGLKASLVCRRGVDYELTVANALWGDRAYPFSGDYLGLTETYYDAPLVPVDFRGAPDESRVEINDWVAAKTKDRITDILPEGAVTNLTRLILTNAIYFKGSWLHPFHESSTRPAPFTLASGEVIETPTMQQVESFGVTETAEARAIALPFLVRDGEAETRQTMLVLVPKDGVAIGDLEQALSADGLAAVQDSLRYEHVKLSLPKFSFTDESPLKRALVRLGMQTAFDPYGADFTGMMAGPAEQLYIQDVLHKAFIDVHEKGAEAAAATAVIVGTTSAPPPPTPFTVDRPFLFAILDQETGAVLFLGRVTDPRS